MEKSIILKGNQIISRREKLFCRRRNIYHAPIFHFLISSSSHLHFYVLNSFAAESCHFSFPTDKVTAWVTKRKKNKENREINFSKTFGKYFSLRYCQRHLHHFSLHNFPLCRREKSFSFWRETSKQNPSTHSAHALKRKFGSRVHCSLWKLRNVGL